MITEGLFAGGGELYATAINGGGLFHYQRSGPTSGEWKLVPGLAGWHDLDAIGRMYGIPIGAGPLHFLRMDGTWEIIAGTTEEVVVTHRVFHRGLMSDRVSRMYPGGDLTFFARCRFYTAGAESLFCVTDQGVDAIDRN
jgi:hypothetical protein